MLHSPVRSQLHFHVSTRPQLLRVGGAEPVYEPPVLYQSTGAEQLGRLKGGPASNPGRQALPGQGPKSHNSGSRTPSRKRYLRQTHPNQ